MKHSLFLSVLVVLAVGAAGWADATDVVYLSGHGRDDPVKWDFFCTDGRNSGKWTTIGVPSNWELQGFGSYNYGNEKRKSNEEGKYRRTFDIPETWKGKRVFIVFEGVMTDTEVLVNGQSAGPKHQGGFYRFKYEITDKIKSADNLLEVNVSKVSSDPNVEAAERQADYWVFGGIYRPVYLEAVPKEFIDWVAIDARADGTFRIDVHTAGIASADTVAVDIMGLKAARGEIKAGQEVATITAQVSGYKTWTAETPNLYMAKVSLKKGDQIVHTITQPFGFRTFEVRPGDGLYLNGQKIKLKGICRHSFWPDSGRCLSKKICYDDVRLIKEMNMNAVRMSHYPPDREFLDACDELGLYVLDELAGWQKPPYGTEIGRKLVKEMVTRDVCHPSILFWDNGNEGGNNRELDGEFARYDPQKRTVLHPWENFGGIDTAHYRDYETTRRKLSGTTLFMPTEFLHGLYDGGLGAGLDDYWNLMYASPMGAGGFLWVLADEGVVRTDRGGEIDVAGNQAPDGIVGPYHQKEGSFYTVKEIWSPIHIGLDTLPPGFNGKLEVENRYDFTNLSECEFEMKLVRFPTPTELGGSITLSSKTITGPTVAPHATGTLDLDLPANWRDAEALQLTASRNGAQIWTWSWDLQGRDHYRAKLVTVGQAGAVAEANQIGLQTGNPLFKFSTGADQPVLLGGGPRLVGGATGKVTFETSRDGDAEVVEAQYEGDMKHARWTFYPTGWTRFDYEFTLEGQFDVFGISFDYPQEKMKGMRWQGRGPYRVWKNRMKGGQIGVWSNPYKNGIPGSSWDYPEFKGYYRDWRWVVFQTQDGDITIVNDTDDLFLGVYRPNDGPKPIGAELKAPDTGIAFLHGIPATGAKSTRVETAGPQAQKNVASGTYRGTVWFHFDAPQK
jgi:hypothetical protein